MLIAVLTRRLYSIDPLLQHIGWQVMVHNDRTALVLL